MTDIGAAIRRVYAAEEAAGRQAVTLDQVPHTYAAITPEWLSAILCRDNAGAQVTDVELAEASSGSSNRQRILVRYNDAGQAAGLPPSIFCKGSIALDNRLMLNAAGGAQAEVNFYTLVKSRIQVPTPVALHARYATETFSYIIVMEDLTGKAEFFDETTHVDLDRACKALHALADLHAPFFEHADLGSKALPFTDWHVWWKTMINNIPGYGAANDRGIELAEAIMPPALFRRRAELWPAAMRAAQMHQGLPRTLLHTDVHLKNWFEHDGRVGLCDWQLVNVGHWSRDFIYAMTTMLRVEDRRAWLPELLRYYIDLLSQKGVPPIDHETAMTLCRAQLPSALSFWALVLTPAPDMPDMHPDATTLTFVERIAAAIDDLDALAALERVQVQD